MTRVDYNDFYAFNHPKELVPALKLVRILVVLAVLAVEWADGPTVVLAVVSRRHPNTLFPGRGVLYRQPGRRGPASSRYFLGHPIRHESAAGSKVSLSSVVNEEHQVVV